MRAKTFRSKVKGTSYYDVDFSVIRDGMPLALVRDPQNPYDRNAIKVLCQGHHIGHVAKALAADLAPMIDAGDTASATVLTVTGGERGRSRGINIEIRLEPRKQPQRQTAAVPCSAPKAPAAAFQKASASARTPGRQPIQVFRAAQPDRVDLARFGFTKEDYAAKRFNVPPKKPMPSKPQEEDAPVGLVILVSLALAWLAWPHFLMVLAVLGGGFFLMMRMTSHAQDVYRDRIAAWERRCGEVAAENRRRALELARLATVQISDEEFRAARNRQAFESRLAVLGFSVPSASELSATRQRGFLTQHEDILASFLSQELVVFQQVRSPDLAGRSGRDVYPVDLMVMDPRSGAIWAVEVDGSSHDAEERAEADERRQAGLTRLGINVLRIRNWAVATHGGAGVKRVIDTIRQIG